MEPPGSSRAGAALGQGRVRGPALDVRIAKPVRWVTTREYEFMYKNALIAKQQIEEVGFTGEAGAVGNLFHGPGVH